MKKTTLKPELSLKQIAAYEKAYDTTPANVIAEHATGRNGIFNAAYSTEVESQINGAFSIEVKDTGSITNQKSSGRCWMFSGLNVIRSIAMRKMHVKNLELSQSYLMFFDKLEKSNFELEAALANLDEADNSRTMDYIFMIGGHQDGGYWHFFTDLVKKYGVCPKSCQIETAATSASTEMDFVLQQLLSRDVCQLRAGHREGKSVQELRALKDDMLSEIYRVLTICIGKPVKEFTYEYEENNPDSKEKRSAKKDESKFHRITMTPKEFFDTYVGEDLDQYVSLVNWPIRGYEMHRTYTTRLTQNVVGTPTATSLNVTLPEMKAAIIASLKGKDLVWFACDVSAYLLRTGGLLDTKLIDVDSLFSTKINFDKGDRLMSHASQCNHAMTLTGVNLDEKGQPNRWKIENSWGEKAGLDGFFVMTDRWFDEFVYEAVVKREYLPAELAEAAKAKPIELDPWAPVNVD